MTRFQKMGLVEPNSGPEVVVTVWGSGVELLRGMTPGRTVVLLHGVKVTSYQDTFGLSFTDYSLLWLDPLRLRWLREWMEATQPTIEAFFAVETQQQPLGRYCFIADLADEQERAEEAKTLSVVAVMADIRVDERAVYFACTNCRRKIEGSHCLQVGCQQAAGLFQWKLPVTFIDHTGKLLVTLFGHLPDELLGLSAPEFASQLALSPSGPAPALSSATWLESLRRKVLWKRWHCHVRRSAAHLALLSISPPHVDQYLRYLRQI